jgi:hypothetical protein
MARLDFQALYLIAIPAHAQAKHEKKFMYIHGVASAKLAEILGFASDSKLLIIHADDVGLMLVQQSQAHTPYCPRMSSMASPTPYPNL